MRLNNIGATCNVNKMVCEGAKQSAMQEDVVVAPVADTSGGAVGTSEYVNPDDNYFFCGASFAVISENCLQSKVRMSCVFVYAILML